MERNVNYFFIGAFFFALLIIMIGFVFWIGRVGINSSKYRIYTLYTENDVIGIGINTTVKYKGISIGAIHKMQFDEEREGIVKIEVAIKKHIPIRVDSELIINSQGFAGISYLDLKQSNNEKIIKSDKEAILILRKSVLSEIVDSSKNIADNIGDIVYSIKELLQDENIQQITKSMTSFESTRLKLDDLLFNANELIKEANLALKGDDSNIISIILPLIDSLKLSLDNANLFFEQGKYFLDKLEDNPIETLFGRKE